jgi:hypothetical protein
MTSALPIFALLFQMNSVPEPKLFDGTVMSTLVRGLRTPGDYTTANSAQNWEDMQQIAFIAADSKTGTTPLYRHTGTGDHRDSLSQAIGGYTAEGILGHTFNAQQTGMEALYSLSNNAGDFATSIHPLAGFSSDESLGYAYKRYGSQLEDLTSITQSGITLSCNKVFGGVLWHITYDGVQFINNFAQGRHLQMSCRWRDQAGTLEHIASEAGRVRYDYSTGLDKYPAYTHMGSPTVFSYADTVNKRLVTKTVPLEYQPNTAEILGGSGWNPVLYDGQSCRKTIHYDYNGMGPVFRYRQTWNFPAAAEADDICQMEASIHLNAGFTNVFRYHPDIGQLEDMKSNWFKNGDSGGFNDTNFGITCFIFADSSNRCLGVVAKDFDHGGSWERVTAINGSSNGVGSGEFDNPFNVIYLLNFQPYQAGDNEYYYYLIVGDLSTVISKTQALYDTEETHLW